MYLPRTRTSNAMHFTNKVTYFNKRSSGDAYPATGTSYSYQPTAGQSKTVSDEPHYNFRQRVKRGEIVMGDFMLQSWHRTQADGTWEFGSFGKPDPNGWGYRYVTGDLAAWVEGRVTDSSNPTGDFASMKSAVVLEAHARMKESKLKTIELAATMGPTIAMLRRPFGASADLIRKINSRRHKLTKKSGRNAKQALYNAWLEQRYGWKPIIMDSFTIMEEASKKMDATFGTRLVARASKSLDRSLSNVQRVSGGLPQLDYADCSCSFAHSGAVSAGVIYELVTHSNSAQMLQILGLRPEDLPASLYELMPFSFVADWFTNTGRWIQAITPTPSVKKLASWVTVNHNSSTRISVKGNVGLGPALPDYPLRKEWTCDCGSSDVHRAYVERTVNPEVASLPSLTLTMSMTQTVDAFALLSQIRDGLAQLKH